MVLFDLAILSCVIQCSTMKNSQWFVSNNIISIRRNVITMAVFIFCLVQLSGCGVIDKRFATHDGAPRVDIDPSKIHDAVPRVEPLHPCGTKDYVLGGRHYKVLKSAKGYVKQGYASWYGSKFHGRQTSTQERFNLYNMTAASPELPLPSYAQVTNLRNGKKVVVRVNDRGPFRYNRVMDLSYAAAKKLGFAESGVAPVKIVAIDPRTWNKNNAEHVNYAQNKATKVTAPKSKYLSKNGRVFLQIGAFAKLDNAKKLSKKVARLINKPSIIEHKSALYHVQIGPLAFSQGNKLKTLLEQNGFEHVTFVGG
ncbi:MAG: lipoprotein A [uncultured bacterium]|nr:MAG: lipoprotein A [uncultured bacterium]HBY56091.1 septal ring lytic transglycosylase RlpA [Coxiellaceae bacterium]